MPLKSIYKKTRNPMEGMGSMPPGYASMGMSQGKKNLNPRLPNWYTQKWRSLAQPQPHTPYGPTIPGRKIKQRGKAVIDANPYRSALKGLQRGTNLPVALIGGEVRGHGASRAGRQARKQENQQEMINKALRNANKAPREVNVAGGGNENPIVNQAQVNDQDLAQVEELKAQIGGVAGAKGDSGPAGPPGEGASSVSGSTGEKVEVIYGEKWNERRKQEQKDREAEAERKRKAKLAKQQFGASLQGRPRVYMPVLDYRRK